MIPLDPCHLPPDTADSLINLQRIVDAEEDFGTRVGLAASRFKQHNRGTSPVFREVRRTLTEMCSGARRCMYCEDSVADEVEHHHPKNLYPELVFVWTNYLYACGPCNGPKNNRFAVLRPSGKLIEIVRIAGEPVAPPPSGGPALLHPRTENPFDFMMLDIHGDTFLFVETADEGTPAYARASYTIRLLQLNRRDYLPVARREAYGSYRARLVEYLDAKQSGASKKRLDRFVQAIKKMQHPTVWSEMRRQHQLIPELTALFQRAPEALTW